MSGVVKEYSEGELILKIVELWGVSKSVKYKWELHNVTIAFIDSNNLTMEEFRLSKTFYKQIIKPALQQEYFKEEK